MFAADCSDGVIDLLLLFYQCADETPLMGLSNGIPITSVGSVEQGNDVY